MELIEINFNDAPNICVLARPDAGFFLKVPSGLLKMSTFSGETPVLLCLKGSPSRHYSRGDIIEDFFDSTWHIVTNPEQSIAVRMLPKVLQSFDVPVNLLIDNVVNDTSAINQILGESNETSS